VKGATVFGDLQIRLDPWEADYGSEIPLEVVEEEGDQDVVLDIEVPAEAWRPIEAHGTEMPADLVFVDGVRRIEARLIVRRAEKVCHGGFGSFAVGAATIKDNAATAGEPIVGRVLAIGSGESVAELIPVAPALTYRPVSTTSREADGPLRAIHNEMRLAEERLARHAAQADGTLVVMDGPLSFEEATPGGAVGYIKRVIKLYVPADRFALLACLPPGARTPLFALRSTRRFARYSWFLRLAAPHRGDSELTGIVRLEVSEALGVDAARRLADATSIVLPRFASRRGRDPRAPQNLLPIGAMEFLLRRRLGDARLARRHIETLIAREATRA
jgi:hypothetical protein